MINLQHFVTALKFAAACMTSVCCNRCFFLSVWQGCDAALKLAAVCVDALFCGVTRLHAGSCCRDLKPENFLLSTKDDNAPLKATDFGLSVFYKPGQTFTDVVGSAYYVAPEVRL